MIPQPATLDELKTLLAGTGSKTDKFFSFDLRAFNRLLEHKPEDMTATVQAGMTLAELQRQLATHGQWLPVDPPHAERLSIGELLGTDASGPRRFGCGTVRDYLIGLKAVLADGRVISSGGKVVKNVAGYELGKLFVGSQGSLGVIVEASFKLRPLPEAEEFVEAKCASLAEADTLIEIVLNSELAPVVLDLHNAHGTSLVLGFAGTREEVQWQLLKAGELGFNTPSSLHYEKQFWVEPNLIRKISVLPSRTAEVLGTLGQAPFVARAGNGIIYCRGQTSQKQREFPSALERRLKDEFDPRHVLPELSP